MASAVLASGNESSWGQSGGGFMGNVRYPNSQLNPNPNPNPRSKPKKKQFHAPVACQVNGRLVDDSPAATLTVADDAYSFNQRSIDTSSRRDFNHGGYVSYNIASYARSELIELKKRLLSELDQVRSLKERIEAGNFRPRSNGSSQFPGKSKAASGSKRPLPSVSGNDSKRAPEAAASGMGAADVNLNANLNANLMKLCRQVLTKLMKHKHSWVFNKPVDAAALGLHDYHQIIKHPMDLGTVKSNFAKNLYTSPLGFAEDVRLTFNNAMLYNPRSDEVHIMADQLLDRFEELFRPINEKLRSNHKPKRDTVDAVSKVSSRNHIPTPEAERSKKPKSNPVPPNLKKREQMPIPIPSSPLHDPIPPMSESPVTTTTPSPKQAPSAKPIVETTNPGKLPKPKAKDVNKREMSMEEKHRLGVGLQNLPPEKMPQLIQIIRKRNEHLAQEGDEIELDIEALDTETLWELDRFVTNWKKLVSKTKRQGLIMSSSATPAAESNRLPDTGETPKKLKKGDAAEEDVDIGDEMPMSNFPPVEIDKDVGGYDHDHDHDRASSSSSSSSGSSSDSSSSDSDSGSSSGSDSEAG